MKKISCTTSIHGETYFQTSITEELGWIEPVFLLISPNLSKILRLPKEPSSWILINHFKVIYIQDKHTFALNFFDKENTIINGDTSELKILQSAFSERKILENGLMYSTFDRYYKFNEVSSYQEYAFLYVANGSIYLTGFSGFTVGDYE